MRSCGLCSCCKPCRALARSCGYPLVDKDDVRDVFEQHLASLGSQQPTPSSWNTLAYQVRQATTAAALKRGTRALVWAVGMVAQLALIA